jgi:hypothetical protein
MGEVHLRNLQFGKKPFVGDERDFKFAAVAAGVEFPTIPNRFGHGHLYNDWMMFGNDQYGDCVFAGLAHQGMIATKLAHRPLTFTTSGVLADYGAVTGFHPDDPNSDQGTFVRDAFSFWRNTGVQSASGARHKIGAYVSIDPKNWDELMQAAYIFSSAGIGWAVPETIWEQWDNGDPFDVVDENAKIIGGHYTVVTGRAGRSTGGMITWGRRKSFTRDFYETYNDETWVAVFENELRNGKTERGFDLTQLNEMLSSLR